MKVKILISTLKSYWYSDRIGEELTVSYNICDREHPFRYSGVLNEYLVKYTDAVITELPKTFCVKMCDDREKWEKYIDWLRKKYERNLDGYINKYYVVRDGYTFGKDVILGTEIHIDDIIKHINYTESQLTVKADKEFDLTTNEGRLAYARKNYPVGTKVISLFHEGNLELIIDSTEFIPARRNGIQVDARKTPLLAVVYEDGKWAEIIKEEINMETQKLSRQGLKEIHGVACSTWKILLEQYGSRNPLEDYIELTREEVNNIFDACTKDQLPIVSKYLKQDDGSVDVMKFKCEIYDNDGRAVIEKRCDGEYAHKSLLLEDVYNWEIKKDSKGKLCLIPTKKK